MHKFSKNLWGVSKLLGLEWWHGAIFYAEDPEIIGVTVQNLLFRATVGFVGTWTTVSVNWHLPTLHVEHYIHFMLQFRNTCNFMAHFAVLFAWN